MPTKFEHSVNTTNEIYQPSTQFNSHKQSTRQLISNLEYLQSCQDYFIT
jgi:hypothetical protein